MSAAASSAAANAPSLTARVLRRVLLPLAMTWLLGAAVALAIASYFTKQAFDRAMIDDAYSVSTNLQAGERGIELMLTPREVRNVLFDRLETVYFAVLRPDGSLLAGQAGLDAPAPERGDAYRFSRIVYQGQPLRAIALNKDTKGLRVVIAQTTRARGAMMERLLEYSLAPQVLLLVLLAAWLWRGIRRELRPLGELQLALDRRDANDLAPVAVARSSSELEGLGDAVNALFDRLEDSVSAQREFAGNVAHELRTPLAGIRALAEYGLSRTSPTVWREQLEKIAASEARASHLVNQLLGLALADERHAGQRTEVLRLDQLAQQAVLRHLARADARGVDLGGCGLDRPASIRGDAALIEGILDNLIDNALRYGGRTVTVELAQDRLSVTDDGPGIAHDSQRDWLQRWTQGPAGQKLGQGAGLGLAIVARYAKLLGAELSLAPASTHGGLRVSITFAPESVALLNP